jgi:hypothetical protein
MPPKIIGELWLPKWFLENCPSLYKINIMNHWLSSLVLSKMLQVGGPLWRRRLLRLWKHVREWSICSYVSVASISSLIIATTSTFSIRIVSIPPQADKLLEYGAPDVQV